MAIAVEASSLSQITELASNPPRFPRNPTETKREPLTLYIARVPGKRDVILSTLKPRLKNVTAEDVNSSLYYLHLNVPEDAEFTEIPTLEEYEGRSSAETISRKPLTSQLDIGPQPVSFPPESRPPSQFLRKPVRPPRAEGLQKDLPSPPPHGDSMQRRPLGPRPPQKSGSLVRKPLPTLPGIENLPMQEKLLPNVNPQSPPGLNRFPPKTFSITLIRRDPASTAQWNVGRISSHPQIDDNTAGTERNIDTAHGQIFLHIDTPGYTKFQQIDKAKQSGTSTSPGFSRQVSIIWDVPSNHKGRGSMERRPTSSDFKSESMEEETMLEASKSGRAKGYVFSSPWNGRCSFATSGGGRSLKCKHALSGNGTRVDTTTPEFYTAVDVSELRFNLPSGAVFSQTKPGPTNTGRRFAASKFSHIRNKLSSDPSRSKVPSSPITSNPNTRPSTARTTDDEDDVEDDDGLDRLGHEKAGGGIRGKRVKLGKLIIHHEGQQMLDLLVAANMGIFWRIWDR